MNAIGFRHTEESYAALQFLKKGQWGFILAKEVRAMLIQKATAKGWKPCKK